MNEFDQTSQEPFKGHCGFHLGLDVVGAGAGAPVYPITGGEVKYEGYINKIGYAVIVEHRLPVNDPAGEFVTAVYYHLKKNPNAPLISGSSVTLTTIIGHITDVPGEYGTGPHLHIGIRSGRYQPGVDPRTQKWYYPGYSNIYRDGIEECNPGDSRHLAVKQEWLPPLEFIGSRELNNAPEPPIARFTMSSGGQSATEGQTLQVTVPFGSTANISISMARSTAAAGKTIAGGDMTIDGSPFFSFIGTPTVNASLGVGMHTVSVVVKDNLGVASTPASGTVIVAANQPPPSSLTLSYSANFEVTAGRPLAGTWSHTGSVSANFNALDWLPATTGFGTFTTVGPSTGYFSGIASQSPASPYTGQLRDVTRNSTLAGSPPLPAFVPIGSQSSATLLPSFMSGFTAPGYGGLRFDLAMIPVSSAPLCTGSEATGQSCRPLGGSPFTLVNLGSLGTSITLQVRGFFNDSNIANSSSPASGRYITQVGLPISQVIGILAQSPSASSPNWTEKAVVNSPIQPFGHAMAYDAARSQVVLFGGGSYDGLHDETWVWDGVSWTQKFPLSSPPRQTGHAMAYDAARGEVVLFGGRGGGAIPVNNDTWVWDGVNWAQRFPANSPAGRWQHSVAYDTARRQVVLFGGVAATYFGDTWVWDGVDWIQKFPASSPSPGRHAMAYDAARGEVVLFEESFPSTGNTWVWDGVNWIRRFPANKPLLSRYDHAMVYDSARSQIVLFGGAPGGRISYNDTWVWDGVNWAQRFPANSPPGRFSHAMAYDAARSQVVLFGGAYGLFDNPGDLGLLSDTWIWP